MLKIFKNSPQNKKGHTQIQDDVACNMEDVIQIFSSFPIGIRISYYPEYKEDITLDSIILAYAVNGDIFYSDTDIQWLKGNTILQLVSEGKRKRYSAIENLQLLIPASAGSEEKLDYSRKESLGRNSGFTTGNNITLMAQQQGGRVPVMQSTVARRRKINTGH